jgi:peptidyl-dipeptidase Dcp
MKPGIFLAILFLNLSCMESNMTNPLLTTYNTHFNTIPFHKIKPEHFEPAFDSAFKSGRAEVEQIIANAEKPTFENTIEALETSGKMLGRISSILFNLNSAATDSSIQALTRQMSPRLSEYQNDITLNETLFSKVNAVYNSPDTALLNGEQKMLLENTYKQFVRNGANLDDRAKEEYRAVTKELSELTVKFGENVLAETNSFILHLTDPADLAGLPEDVLKTAAEEAEARQLDGWVFTLQFPSYAPFLKYADNRDLREKMSRAYGSRGLKDNANDNREIVRRIAELRLTMANLLDYPTYADFVLSNRMAESTERVNAFLNELLEASMPFAKRELAEVQEYASRNGADFTLNSWDWSYYSEKLKMERFNIDDEATRPYFKLENVEKGVFDLAKNLFGLTFKENEEIPVYHADVKAFEVYDHDGSFLAILYIDYFPRENKRGGAWMTSYVRQSRSRGEDIRPHVSLVCNFTKPTTEKPSLLTYNEVRTLLHEFGHGLHGMLSDVHYESLSGTSVYRDFVELPSQLLENWAEEKEWLNSVAIHHETNERMPDEMLDNIVESKNFTAAYHTVRQLSFGFTDMSWHSKVKPYSGDIIEFERQAMSSTQLFPMVDGVAMSPSFSHIFSGGYAAGYYSYKWAEVLDADAFSLFKEKGIFDRETAASFREHILSKGGTEHPMKLYVRFRGHEPSIDPLLERSGLR